MAEGAPACSVLSCCERHRQVPERDVKQALAKYGIRRFAKISDFVLDGLVEEKCKRWGHRLGAVYVVRTSATRAVSTPRAQTASLLRDGLRVARERVAASLQRVSPVPGPLSRCGPSCCASVESEARRQAEAAGAARAARTAWPSRWPSRAVGGRL